MIGKKEDGDNQWIKQPKKEITCLTLQTNAGGHIKYPHRSKDTQQISHETGRVVLPSKGECLKGEMRLIMDIVIYPAEKTHVLRKTYSFHSERATRCVASG